jgi:hypothetical protein
MGDWIQLTQNEDQSQSFVSAGKTLGSNSGELVNSLVTFNCSTGH